MMLLAVLLAIFLIVPPFVGLSAAQQRAVDIAEWLIWAAFAVELGTRLYLAPARLRYMRSHWYDIALVVLPFLRPLRLARALRVVRYPIAAALVACIGLATAMPLAERDAEGASITDLADGLWWAATTITTVGYGDVSPVTALGRGLAFALMLIGIATFGAVTASIAAYFVAESAVEDEADILKALRDVESRLARLEGSRRTIESSPPTR